MPIGSTSALVRQRQKFDHDATGAFRSLLLQQRLEGAGVGAARKELVAIHEMRKRHRLAPQGVDDVPIIDDMTVLAAGMGAAARQGKERRRTEESFQRTGGRTCSSG